jgi:signal transduction histidine kinase
VVEKSIKHVSQMAQKKSITIHDQTTDIKFEGNAFGMIDLLVILLDNAIKYTANEKNIFLFSKQKDGYFQILVQDQGIGLNEKDIPHLFDRFYRADEARSKETIGGYGLGLSIAKKIVESHKGMIQAKKNLEAGSTFVVQIPIKQSFIRRPHLFS